MGVSQTNSQRYLQDRVKRFGPSSLTDFQLIQYIMELIGPKQGAPGRTIDFFNYHRGFGQVKYMDLGDWRRLVKNEDRAVSWLVVGEVAKRMIKAERPILGEAQSSPAVAKYLAKLIGAADQETLRVLCLDAQNRLLHEEEVFRGTLDSSLVHPREIMAVALKFRSARFIIAHNHPSNVVTPSNHDREFTTRLAKCGKLMGIELLDHLIVGANSYFSFREQDLL